MADGDLNITPCVVDTNDFFRFQNGFFTNKECYTDISELIQYFYHVGVVVYLMIHMIHVFSIPVILSSSYSEVKTLMNSITPQDVLF